MLKYEIEYSDDFCDKYFSKLPKNMKERIVAFIEQRISVDPFHCGECLKGKLSGLMRARCGDYRIVYLILEDKIVIQIVKINHRKDVYL